MKKFLKTKFFFVLKESSEKGIDADAGVLQKEYDRFAALLFSEGAALPDRAAYHNTLAYIRVELAGMETAGKKM